MRLRSIRMKSGGAPIYVLHNPMPNQINEHEENWRGKLIENAKYIANRRDDLDGYLVIGFFADGGRSMGFRMSPRVPKELFPSYIAEILRTDAITVEEASIEFDRRFEWVDR